jgi:hypothetical protein
MTAAPSQRAVPFPKARYRWGSGRLDGLLQNREAQDSSYKMLSRIVAYAQHVVAKWIFGRISQQPVEPDLSPALDQSPAVRDLWHQEAAP